MSLQYAIDVDDVEQLATDDHSAEEVIEALLAFGKRMDAESRRDLVADTTYLEQEAQDG